jgi:hypothetical protein
VADGPAAAENTCTRWGKLMFKHNSIEGTFLVYFIQSSFLLKGFSFPFFLLLTPFTDVSSYLSRFDEWSPVSVKWF